MKQSTYDIIVCGGGAGGLSFLAQWMDKAPAGAKVLLLEAEPKIKNDKTWCYWSENPLPYPESHVKKWSTVNVSHGGRTAVKQSEHLNYFEIDSLKFYREVHKRMDAFSSVSRLITTVNSIQTGIQYCTVNTTEGTFRARHVINSVPNLLQKLPTKYFLTQNFKGIRIKTTKPAFLPEQVELMDFYPINDKGAASFFYVLPYNEHEALVEYTRLSSDILDEEDYLPYIRLYLREKFDVQDFKVIREEFGVIPMSDFAYKQRPQPRVFQIGTIGGDTKPTTGYTFHFIQKHAQDIVQEIAFGQGGTKRSKRFRFYDKLLLSIICTKPHRTGEIMYALFKNLPLTLVFKFLDEKTSLFEEAFIFSFLPKSVFLKALLDSKPPLYERNSQVLMDNTLRRAE